MAIKKCDDTIEEVVLEGEAIDTTLGPIESQTAETQTPSQVKENAALGKRLVVVEPNICDKTELSLSPVTTFGNGYVMSARPSDIVDPLRAEARKFFATDYNNQLVYVNSSLKELGDNQSTRASYGTSPITIASLTEPEIDSKSSNFFGYKMKVIDEEYKYTQTFLVSSNQFVVNGGDAPSPNLADSWKVFVNGEIDAITPTTSPQTTQTFAKVETVAGELGPYDFGRYVEYEGGVFHRKPDDIDVALEFLSDMGEDGWDRPTKAVEILEWLVSRDEKEAKRKTSEIRQELELLDRFHNTSYTKWKTKEYYGEDSYVSRDIFGRIKYSKEFDDVYVPELGAKTPVRAVAYFHYPVWEDPYGTIGGAYMAKENPEKAEEFIEAQRIITLEVFYPRFRVDPSADIDLQTFSLISRPSPLIDIQTMFTDHYTNIVTPFDQDELELYLNNVNNPAYANVKGKYNFFVPNYENYIQSGDIKEYQLENQFSNMTRGASSLQQELFNLGSDLSYVKGIQSLETRVGYDRVTEKFKNIGIPSTQVSKIKTVTDTDDLYPMINTFEMNTERSGHFMVASQQAGSIDGLLKHIMDQTIIYPSDRVSQSYFSGSVNFVLSSEKVVNNSGQTSIEVNNETRLIQTIDIFSWLEKYLNSELEVNSNFDDLAIILGDGAKSQSGTMSSTDCNESNFADTLRALILSGKIKQIVKDNFRTFEELLEGKEAYNEALVYEIVKSTSDENYLQRIFIPNTEELDLLKYIDTQIKYDKQYKYSVYVHQLIVGTKYQYTNFTGATSNFTTEFSVSYEPSLKIARLPIFVDTTRVLDHAPVAPDVNLVPFKGHSTRLMININSSVGDYDLQPIIFTDADQTFAAKYRESRNLSDTDPIKFKSDDPVQTFEMYRTTTPPKSYDDFAESVVEVLSSVDATSVSFIDTVEPNKKYYYTFRAIDVHGNRSNPTDVYMAELVEFEGMIFFNNSVYQFQQEAHDNVDVSRSFKRYLRISPAMIHKLINYKNTFQDKMSGEELTATSAYEASDVSLGSAESTVWGKRFKMRITSKNSGKKFDINFTCKTRFINDAPEPIALQSGDQDPSKQGKK